MGCKDQSSSSVKLCIAVPPSRPHDFLFTSSATKTNVHGEKIASPMPTRGQYYGGRSSTRIAARRVSVLPITLFSPVPSSQPASSASNIASLCSDKSDSITILCLWGSYGSSFATTRKAFDAHFKLCHPLKTIQKCFWDGCNEVALPCGLRRHVMSTHTHVDRRICEECGELASRADALARHVREGRCGACSICDRQFSHVETRITHEAVCGQKMAARVKEFIAVSRASTSKLASQRFRTLRALRTASSICSIKPNKIKANIQNNTILVNAIALMMPPVKQNAAPKGWKGWVSLEGNERWLNPRKSINQVQVISERRTRSGLVISPSRSPVKDVSKGWKVWVPLADDEEMPISDRLITQCENHAGA